MSCGVLRPGHLPISTLPSFYRNLKSSFIIIAVCFKAPSVFSVSSMAAAVRVSALGKGDCERGESQGPEVVCMYGSDLM